MHRFYAPDITTTMLLPDEEAQHCVRVLRLKEGEEVEVVVRIPTRKAGYGR